MAEKEQKDLFRHPAVKPASLPDLSEISDKLGLQCTEDELKEFKDYMNQSFEVTYGRLMQLDPPTLPVKYPRTPGYKPPPEENKHNAWFWKCDIKGVSEGILKGKTVAMKGNICVAGVPLINGSSLLEGYTPDVDATVVTRILDAGGNIKGKAHCENMCFSSSSFTNVCGPCLNPHDVTRTTGGSSSGSGALVAAGDVDMAIGGDQGGSVRTPAGWCGIVGLKPTFGLVPYTGAMPVNIIHDHLGPMTRTVSDCALLLEAIAGYDNGLDPRQPRDIKVRQYSKELSADMKGKRVGVLKEGFDECEEDVFKIVKEAANMLTKAGALVEEVSIPIHNDGFVIWSGSVGDGAYKCGIQGNGNGYNWRGMYVESFQEALHRGFQTKSGDLSDTMKFFYLASEYVDKRYGNKFYARAQNLAITLTHAYDTALEKYDVIVMPTLPRKPHKLPDRSSTVKERLEKAVGMIRNTAPFDVTGHPALSINAGFSDKLPVGMMIVGKQFDETSVLQAA